MKYRFLKIALFKKWCNLLLFDYYYFLLSGDMFGLVQFGMKLKTKNEGLFFSSWEIIRKGVNKKVQTPIK